MLFLGRTNVGFSKVSLGSETLDMTLGEMFEVNFVDLCADKFLLMLMGGLSENFSFISSLILVL
jgi:hypothetical protein